MPEVWYAGDAAWIVTDGASAVGIDAAPAAAAVPYQDMDALWLTSTRPRNFDLARLAHLPRSVRVVTDEDFPSVESEAVEMLNFGVHRLPAPELTAGQLTIARHRRFIRVSVGEMTSVIYRHDRAGDDCPAAAAVVYLTPGERRQLAGQAFAAAPAKAAPLAEPQDRGAPQAILGPFASDQEQQAAFTEVFEGLQRLGTRLGAVLQVGGQQRLTAAVAREMAVVVQDGPGGRDFAFRFDVSRYGFLPVPLPPGYRLPGHTLRIHLQDYWGMLQGHVLAWSLADEGIVTTGPAITGTGAALVDLWCSLHESRFEPKAVGIYYRAEGTDLLNQASIAFMGAESQK
jgi:hypothetical protein